MFGRVEQAVESLRGVLADLQPGCLAGSDAARLVDLFAEVERLGAAGKAIAARRVEDSNLWRREGCRSAAQWVANRTGATMGQAIGALETARRLDDLPATASAFRSGQLSETQAREITGAAAAAPEAERELLDAARTDTVAQLRERCRRVQAAAASDEANAYERIRRSRYLRHWTERDGAVRLDARLTPDDGALLLAAVDARRQQIFAEARAAGRRERTEAYAADALVSLARTPGEPSARVELRLDYGAFVRGHSLEGEVCEIPGIGPIPVAVARRLVDDGILRAVVTDGTDVQVVSHLGRTIPARLRTALEARDPVCVVPGCDVRTGLEIDHRTPFAEGGPTSLENCARICRFHHDLKTYRGYRLGGGPGQWTWTGPDEPEPTDGGDEQALFPP